MKNLNQILDDALVEFKKIPTEAWEYKPGPGKWSKKEILGHLVDSARNNLQRFLEVQYASSPYQVIPYQQDHQVIANAYQKQSLDVIKNMWESINRHIGYVIRCQDQQSLTLPVVLPDGTETHLGWLMQDYIDHLQHHLKQIQTRKNP